MNKLNLVAGALALLLLAACAGVGDAPDAATGDAVAVANPEGTTLAIDTARSRVDWKAAKVTRAHDGGIHDFSGTITVSGSDVTGVTLDMDLNSIWSDTEKLTGHLMSDDFFDVAQFPTARFEASDFAPLDSAGATHTVTGNLTMHGVTRGVSFPASILVTTGGATATADFIINRRDWNINYDGKADDLIRDDVRILFSVVAGTADVPVAEAASEAEAAPATP